MKFVVSIQAGFNIFINIKKTFLKHAIVLYVYIIRRGNKHYGEFKCNDLHKNFTDSKDMHSIDRKLGMS
jgi:hypothetical protein